MEISKDSIRIKIADAVVRVDSDVDFTQFNDFGFYKDFIVPDDALPDCRLNLKIGPPPDLELDEDHFTASNWRLSKSGSKNVLRVGPPPERGSPDNVVVFNGDYSEGAMYQESVFELFRRFIDQFLLINLLSREEGFLLHAAGVIWEGKGLCFIGPSGAGKSTLLNLFGAEVERENLLNDDRVALKKVRNDWRVFGTPWYGESRVSSSGSANLSALFFIRHSKTNYIRPMPASQVCRNLAVQALVPVWDADATSRVLATFQEIIQKIPAFELGFLPDKSVVDLIKRTVKEI